MAGFWEDKRFIETKTGRVRIYSKGASEDTKNVSVSDHITFTENGSPISKQQAVEDSKPLVLDPAQKEHGSFGFSTEGKSFSGKPVGEATSLHKEVSTKTVTTTVEN